MTTLVEHIIVAGTENHPLMLEKSMHDSQESRIQLFIKRKKHGRMMLDSIDNGLLVYLTVEEDGHTRSKKYSKLPETIPQNLAFQTEDLDAYDSDCDDLSSAKVILMANLLSCDSAVLSEIMRLPVIFPYSQYLQESQDAEQDLWLKHSNYYPDTSAKSHTPVRIEAPSKLLKSQEKDTVIRKLKDRIKSLSGKDSIENVKKDIDEIAMINTELEHNLNAQFQEKVFAIAALKNELRKHKGKNVFDIAVSKPSATIAP
uniref:Uncharacterized protein n=1 Tax=Tanacetum cinerariifolium TaxID=118510 RepID=A0A6L2L3K5_TANCI|nr:hypothetical protein [Tanacetum cinerariifolium]